MAKGKDKSSKGKADKNWMDRLSTPSRRQFLQFMQAQQTQYDPLIGRLQMQIAGNAPEKDPVVQAYERMTAGLPTEQAIAQSYGTGLQNVANFMQGVNVARGGQGVSEAVKAIGGAIGGETGATADVAGAAGAVSGVGAGQDVISQALMESAGARFKGLETQRLGEVAGQRQEFALGAGQARLSARERQRELARAMAEAKGKKKAAVLNPFDIANMVMSYQSAKRGMSGGGTGGGGAQTPTPDGGVDPAEVAYRQQAIASGLQGLVTPQAQQQAAADRYVSTGMQQGGLGVGYGPVIPGKYMAPPKKPNASRFQGKK